MTSKCFDENVYCYGETSFFVQKTEIFDDIQLK